MLGYALAAVVAVAALVVIILLARKHAAARRTMNESQQRAVQLQQRAAQFEQHAVQLQQRAVQSEQHVGHLQQQLIRFQPIIDIEAQLAHTRQQIAAEQQQAHAALTASHSRIVSEREAANQELRQKHAQVADIQREIALLKSDLAHLNAEAIFEAHGLYESRYDFGTAEEYSVRRDQIREHQKNMVKDGIAAICRTTWTVEGNAAKGRKMIDDKIKLMLRAFNGECDAAVLRVKYNNIEALATRIRRSHETINKLAAVNQCEITQAYLNLKLEELSLTHEYQEKVQAEREEQRLIKEQMRDEERAAKEIEAAQKQALAEEQKLAAAIAKAREQAEEAAGKRHDQLMGKIEALQAQLVEATAKRARAVARAQLTRSGHVYVISNVGSFGDGIHKIGMTRRLEPLDRVKELGDASVPFQFDVHAVIYAPDAPKLEKTLHDRFANKRVNLINQRKEFFHLNLSEIEVAVKEMHGDISFVKTAAAEEYRKTQALRNRPAQVDVGT
jgi:hypothetical protein